jgi:hypothetical protein
VDTPNVRRSRGPAVIATAVALALINVGLASLIVAAVGAPGLAPVWLSVLLVAVGIAAAVGCVSLWRQYLGDLRQNR